MKKLILFFILISFSSCKKSLGDVDFTTNLSKTSDEIVVNKTKQQNVLGVYETEFVLDLSNSDTKEYLNKLKNLDLKEVGLSFQGLSGLINNRNVTTLSISFDDQVVIVLNNFVYSQVANGNVFNLTQTQKLNEVAQILLNKKKVKIKIVGNIPDPAEYHFFIKFMAKADITANVL